MKIRFVWHLVQHTLKHCIQRPFTRMTFFMGMDGMLFWLLQDIVRNWIQVPEALKLVQSAGFSPSSGFFWEEALGLVGGGAFSTLTLIWLLWWGGPRLLATDPAFPSIVEKAQATSNWTTAKALASQERQILSETLSLPPNADTPRASSRTRIPHRL